MYLDRGIKHARRTSGNEIKTTHTAARTAALYAVRSLFTTGTSCIRDPRMPRRRPLMIHVSIHHFFIFFIAAVVAAFKLHTSQQLARRRFRPRLGALVLGLNVSQGRSQYTDIITFTFHGCTVVISLAWATLLCAGENAKGHNLAKVQGHTHRGKLRQKPKGTSGSSPARHCNRERRKASSTSGTCTKRRKIGEPRWININNKTCNSPSAHCAIITKPSVSSHSGTRGQQGGQ